MSEGKNEKMQYGSNITALLACDKPVQYEFCEWAEQFGASKRTLIDTLLLGYRGIDRWKLIGIDNMVRNFCPDYQDSALNYYENVGLTEKFYEYMNEMGGMCRTTSWSRFSRGAFKQWELIGLDNLAGMFLNTKVVTS